MKSKRYDNAKSKSIYSISHRLLLSVKSSKNKKKNDEFREHVLHYHDFDI